MTYITQQEVKKQVTPVAVMGGNITWEGRGGGTRGVEVRIAVLATAKEAFDRNLAGR